MAAETSSPKRARSSEKRGELIANEIRQMLARNELQVGDRLPTEHELCAAHGVSRTVIREAIAALRSDGLVVARQGAGMFVTEPKDQNFGLSLLAAIEPVRISEIIETLELRIALESEAAALAAERRSPAELANIQECFEAVAESVAAGGQAADQDFAFHLAIAEAAHNHHFVEFLHLLGQRTIPRRQLHSDGMSPAYLQQIQKEHLEVVGAIVDQDSTEAHASMRAHLRNSLKRYQKFAANAKSSASAT